MTRKNPLINKIKNIIDSCLGDYNLFAVYPSRIDNIRTLLASQAFRFSGHQADELNEILEKLKKFNTKPAQPLTGNPIPSSAVLYISNHNDDDFDDTVSETESFPIWKKGDYWPIDEERHWPTSNLAEWQEEQLCFDGAKSEVDEVLSKSAPAKSSVSLDSKQERKKWIERNMPVDPNKKVIHKPVNNKRIEIAWQKFKSEQLKS